MGIPDIGIRTARAAVFAALCVVLSTGAHVLLSGQALPLAAVAAVATAVFCLAFLLAGSRERRFGQIAALLVPLQLAADAVFTAGQSTCYAQSGGPVPGPLRLFGVDLVCAGGNVGTPLATLVAGGESPLTEAHPPAGPWLLLAAHVAVGLTAALWLRGGEAALARLLRSAAASTFRPLLVAVAVHATPEDTRRPTPRTASPRAAAPAFPLLSHSVLRRGPPRFALAA